MRVIQNYSVRTKELLTVNYFFGYGIGSVIGLV